MSFVATIGLLVFSSCTRETVISSYTGIEVRDFKSSKSDVIFSLVNVSQEKIGIESTWRLYIEKELNGEWERVPHLPCPCGTPCKPPQQEFLSSSEQVDISWDLISRSCQSAGSQPMETIESRVEKGSYRMTFMINPTKDGKRLNPEKFIVEFKVK